MYTSSRLMRDTIEFLEVYFYTIPATQFVGDALIIIFINKTHEILGFVPSKSIVTIEEKI